MSRHYTLPIVFLMVLSATRASGYAAFKLQNALPPVLDAPVFDAAGQPLEGERYRAELWGGPTPDSLEPAVALGTGERVMVPFLIHGYFADTWTLERGPVVIRSVLPWVEPAWLQVRAWDTQLGATYEEVVALGLGGYGESPLFQATGSDPFDYKAVPAPLIGLQSFRLRPVIPEPSTWALIAVGGGVLVWMTRRKR